MTSIIYAVLSVAGNYFSLSSFIHTATEVLGGGEKRPIGAGEELARTARHPVPALLSFHCRRIAVPTITQWQTLICCIRITNVYKARIPTEKHK